MNLLFLVEGGKTEPKIYQAWLQHTFPQLISVIRPEDMKGNSFRIVSGHGYPNMISPSQLYGGISRLEACLLDIKNYNNVDYFFICVDAEENSYQDRFNEIQSKLDSLKQHHVFNQCLTEFHIIIQDCCIETWALGNAEILQQYAPQTRSSKLGAFQAYYNISVDDPEKMSCCPSGYFYSTKAKFHEVYLKEYLKEFGLSYSKKKPEVVGEKKYLEALKKRCISTHHLSSLKLLLDLWDQL